MSDVDVAWHGEIADPASIAAGVYLGYASVMGPLGCDECDGPNPVGLFIALVPMVLDLVTGAAYGFPPQVDADLAPARTRRMEVPGPLCAALDRSLARAAAPAVS